MNKNNTNFPLDKTIQINEEVFVSLKYRNSIQPSKMHIKTECYYPCSELLYKQKNLFEGTLFTPEFVFDNTSQKLVLVEYIDKILNNTAIEFKNDVVQRLRIIDFKNRMTASFSNLKGGTFSEIKILNDKTLYQKQKNGLTRKMEVLMEDLKWLEFSFFS